MAPAVWLRPDPYADEEKEELSFTASLRKPQNRDIDDAGKHASNSCPSLTGCFVVVQTIYGIL